MLINGIALISQVRILKAYDETLRDCGGQLARFLPATGFFIVSRLRTGLK